MYEHGNRIITCKNVNDDIRIKFNEREFAPFLLCKASGIYDSMNTIHKSDNTVINGAEYLGSVMQARNIVLTLKDVDNYDKNREKIDQVFQTGALGILNVQDDSHEREIEYYTESVESTATTGSRLTTISLLCPDPNFYDPFESIVRIAAIQDRFQFPHNFIESGEEFSFFNDNRIAEIYNDTAEEYTGLTMVITFYGVVVNPSIVMIETQEAVTLGDENNPRTFSYGDVVTITTHTGNKNVMLTSNGETQIINNYLTFNSVFFQLKRGINYLGCAATTGRDNMVVKITYKNKYARA